jgi:hypothetical protein
VTTPLATKLALLVTLVIAIGAVVDFLVLRPDGEMEATFVAPYLWLFTGLFLVRVVGQLVVRFRAPSWLPPMSDWNLTPYHLLLPTQLVILGAMAWIDVDFSSGSGAAATGRRALGLALLAFSGVYAAAMAVRYLVRMSRRPRERWFGGTIPIVFHWVLASYLFVLGSFDASH